VSTDRDFTDVDETTAELRRYLKPIRVGSFLREVMGWIGRALSAIERRRWSDLERPFEVVTTSKAGLRLVHC